MMITVISNLESLDYVKDVDIVRIDSTVLLTTRVKESFKSYSIIKELYSIRDSINHIKLNEEGNIPEDEYDLKLESYYDRSEKLQEKLRSFEEELPNYPNDDSLGFVHFFNSNVIFENNSKAKDVQLIGFTNNEGEVHKDYVEMSTDLNIRRIRKHLQ